MSKFLTFACGALVGLALALLSVDVHASQSAHQGADWVRIWNSPCVSAETLARIPQEERAAFQKVQGYVGGKLAFGCALQRGNMYFILWEDGDQGVVPASELKQDPEA
jgi:hypothetical protein